MGTEFLLLTKSSDDLKETVILPPLSIYTLYLYTVMLWTEK